MIRLIEVITVLSACLVAPQRLAAQSAWTVGPARVDLARAETLYQRATRLFDQPRRYAESARLLITSARFREPSDRRAFKTMHTAAKLYTFAGDHSAAQRSFEAAAEMALNNGELVDAANALLDAAIIAVERRNRNAAALVERARRLATSSVLGSDDQSMLLGRIVSVGAAASRITARR